MKKANSKSMQASNRRLILGIARKNGALSQAEMIRKSGLSAGAVVDITRRLRKEQFLLPAGKGESKGGRRPVILKFNSRARYIVSAVCLHNRTRIALVDLMGVIIAETSFPTRPLAGVDAFLRDFKHYTDSLMASMSVVPGRVMSVCVSFEGMVDARCGVLIHSERLGWNDVPFKKRFKELFGVGVNIESEVRASVLGEFYLGGKKPVHNLVYMVLGSGIGMSIIQEGRVFLGANQMEGEIGHTIKEPAGPLCRCGKRGCLEALASGPAIIAAARDAMVPGMDEAALHRSEEEAFLHVLRMAEQGDKSAIKVLRKAASLLGNAVADTIKMLDPERLVLVGYMVGEQSEYFFRMINNAANASCLWSSRRKTQITVSALGDDAVILGGAMLICRDMFPFL